MKKSVCFVVTVFVLMVVLCVPCFAVESTVDRGDPVDWFGGGVTYSLSFIRDLPCTAAAINSDPSFKNWLIAIGATSPESAVGPFSVDTGNTSYNSNVTANIYVVGDRIVQDSGSGNSYVYNVKNSQSYTVSSSLGLTEAQSLPSYYINLSIIGSEGFVDAGISDALTELSSIVSVIFSNQYILIAIGLAVAVPLVSWGISKIKSLVKGY